MARRYVLPSGLVLEVGALNSNILRTGAKEYPGMGMTSNAALADVAGELAWDESGERQRAVKERSSSSSRVCCR